MWVYVAGSVHDVRRVSIIQTLVRLAGHQITFDWTSAEGEIRTDGSWDSDPEQGARIAQKEINAARASDLTIVLGPPPGHGLGCWIEVGAAIAGGGKVLVVDPPRDSVFWQHPQVARLTLKELLDAFAPMPGNVLKDLLDV